MNGVARDFWSEIYDLRSPVDDERGSGGGGRKQRRKSRKVLVRRPGARRSG
jgi:hypothetical protein